MKNITPNAAGTPADGAAFSKATSGYGSKLEAALAHARAGFPVLPVWPNTKTPIIKGWQNRATTDETIIRQWWAENPDANIGIEGSGLLIVDIDPRKGGDKTWAAIIEQAEMLGDELPKTTRVKTWSGGAHIYFRLPEGVKIQNETNGLGPGIDVKTAGGFVVAPGSTIDGKPYEFGNTRPVAIAPPCVLTRCGKAKPKAELAGKCVCAENEYTYSYCEEYIANQAPYATEARYARSSNRPYGEATETTQPSLSQTSVEIGPQRYRPRATM